MLEAIMKRQPGTVERAQITNDIIERVWQNGKIINGNSPTKYRQDICGAWIMKEKYGQTDSSYGWEIDMIDPTVEDKNALSNLRPLQWENKKGKVNDELVCVVKAKGPNNI